MAEPAPCRRRHVVILSSHGMGHLIPSSELARRLSSNFAVTLVVHPTGHSAAELALIHSLAADGSISVLTAPQPESIPDGIQAETRILLTIQSNLSFYLSALKPLSPLAAVIGDMFFASAIDIAADLGAPAYIFFTGSCNSLAVKLQLPKLAASFPGEFRDLPEPIRVPGCVPIHGRDLLDAVQDRSSSACMGMLHLFGRYSEPSGILVNSCEDLEPGAVAALKEMSGLPPVYPVGPLISHPTGDQKCLIWLDQQPVGSVLYVSFGSGGTLTRDQIHELAYGLEDSGHRFLWVVKGPHDQEANAAFFTAHNAEDPFHALPDGFMERTKGTGLLVRNWAPQTQVLSRASVGGFLTHCGWNSTLDSIVNGVPLIAWPLYAEQRMNAVMLVDGVKVALRPRASESGLVSREEVSRVVKALMEEDEGRKLRDKMSQLSMAASHALGEEGSSVKTLSELAHEWETPKEN